ncbi:MAG: hypothetical protein CME06_03770 [Gemmatimonadetes bacterium]|nr:hypothetical protein [Gemmatimonadota bacterium]
MTTAAPPLPEPVSDAELIDNCIESFGDHPSGHPDMWRHWYRLIGRHHPAAALHWLCAWSYIRWADNLLDLAPSPEEFARTLEWGMERLRCLVQGGAPENVREQALGRFLKGADPQHVKLFFRITAAAEHEKSQLEGAPSEEALGRIIEYNAVLPVLLHCRLLFEAEGHPPDLVRDFGESFGQVTRYADVFVDLEEDLEAGIVPISRESCDRLGIEPGQARSVTARRAIRAELQSEYRIHRARARSALEKLEIDRRTGFAYGIVLQAFDRCVYGARAIPGFALYLARFTDQTIPLVGFVARSVLVSRAERKKAL